jgi:hypothetical protein
MNKIKLIIKINFSWIAQLFVYDVEEVSDGDVPSPDLHASYAVDGQPKAVFSIFL